MYILYPYAYKNIRFIIFSHPVRWHQHFVALFWAAWNDDYVVNSNFSTTADLSRLLVQSGQLILVKRTSLMQIYMNMTNIYKNVI